MSCGNVSINNGVVKIDGEVVDFPGSLNGGITNSVIGDKIYLNGYEYFPKTKTFKRTLVALLHHWF